MFCGSHRGGQDAYTAAARALGASLASAGIGLVYGGGNVGLMAEIADTVLAAKGEVIGVIPEELAKRELAHDGLDALHIVGSMHERKAMMANLSDAFIAMPGGLGTLEEIFEVLAWRQLKFHDKPCGLLNIEGYYDDLLSFLDGAVSQGFLYGKHRNLLIADSDAERLLHSLEACAPMENQ